MGHAEILMAMHGGNVLSSLLTTIVTTSKAFHSWRPAIDSLRVLPGLWHPHNYALISYAVVDYQRQGVFENIHCHLTEDFLHKEQSHIIVRNKSTDYRYMGPQWLAPLREICSNLVQRKHELVWLRLPTKQKSFRLKVPKASYLDTALDDLRIQTLTHSTLLGWSRCKCKSTWVLCTHKKTLFN